MAIFFAVSMVLGLVANAIVFIVSFQDYRSQKKSFVSTYFVLRQTIINLFCHGIRLVFSLCLADTFQLTLLPFKIDSRYYRACWRFGAIGCHIHNCFTNFNLFVSIFFLGNKDYKLLTENSMTKALLNEQHNLKAFPFCLQKRIFTNMN